MKKTSYTLSTLALLAPFATPIFANGMHDHGSGMEMKMEKPAIAQRMQAHQGQGTVNRIDTATGTVNLTHGPIKSLDWSGMTMDFKVKDKAALDRIKPGTNVDFEVVKEADGTFAITRITPAK